MTLKTSNLASRLAAAVAVTSAAVSGQSYTVTDLGSLGGNYIYPLALNERGDATGHSSSGNGPRAFLYTDAVGMQDLGVLPGASASSGRDLNELREVVGQSGGIAFRRPFGGGMVDILAGLQGYALGANNRGEVVGWLRPSPTAQETPFVYRDGAVSQILNGAYGWALGINEAGTVIGTWGGSGGSTWDAVNGSQAIPVLSGYGSNDLGGINDFGVVAGRAWSSSGTGAWFRYSATSGLENLGVGAQGLVRDINNRGDVVGSSSASASRRAYLFTDQGGFQNLNGLIPQALGYVLVDAVAINDAGQILCEAVSGPLCCRRAVRLDPVVRSATATAVGLGCTSGSVAPALLSPPPVLGGTMSWVLTDGPANSAGILVGSLGGPTSLPLGSCTVHVDQGALVLSVLMLTDGAGAASYGVSIPANAAFAGLPVTSQVVTVGAATAPGVDLSNALFSQFGA